MARPLNMYEANTTVLLGLAKERPAALDQILVLTGLKLADAGFGVRWDAELWAAAVLLRFVDLADIWVKLHRGSSAKEVKNL